MINIFKQTETNSLTSTKTIPPSWIIYISWFLNPLIFNLIQKLCRLYSPHLLLIKWILKKDLIDVKIIVSDENVAECYEWDGICEWKTLTDEPIAK